MAEKCGLKLVEAPVEQTNHTLEENPFQSVINIPLLLKVPSCEQARIEFDDANFDVPNQWFESEILKQFDFILDIEADAFIDPESIVYSYSRTTYKYTQFIHKSGSAFIQIRDDNLGFNWIVNHLLVSSSGNTPINQRGVQQSINADLIRKQVTEFCADVDLLSEFYQKMIQKLRNAQVKLYTGSIHTISSEDLSASLSNESLTVN